LLGWGKYVKLRKSEKVGKWVGSGRWRLRLGQNDRTGCPEVLGVVLAENYLLKNKKTRLSDFRFRPVEARELQLAVATNLT